MRHEDSLLTEADRLLREAGRGASDPLIPGEFEDDVIEAHRQIAERMRSLKDELPDETQGRAAENAHQYLAGAIRDWHNKAGALRSFREHDASTLVVDVLTPLQSTMVQVTEEIRDLGSLDYDRKNDLFRRAKALEGDIESFTHAISKPRRWEHVLDDILD